MRLLSPSTEVFTVGHSTRSLEELVSLLWSHGVATLVDVRTIPRSRKNPQFNEDELEKKLPRFGLAYAHVKELGGLRKTSPDSPNKAWRNASFRGFADHMQTDEFERGLARLEELEPPLALMCAEAVPWRCHRSLIADALTARGAVVRDIASRTSAPVHRLTPFARVKGGQVTYPAPHPGPPPAARGEGAPITDRPPPT
ncbi:MAG TPA: DUF488 domain-containing protein [Planctomycetota bacterium]|nr:DUF488 domain-containing protein [Planctomycetota bacterium]